MANNKRNATAKTARFAMIPIKPINNLLMRPFDIHDENPAVIRPINDKTVNTVMVR